MAEKDKSSHRLIRMEVIPIKTDRVDMNPEGEIIEWILSSLKKNDQELKDGDVFVISSKVVSFFEDRVMDLSWVKPSEKAKQLAAKDTPAEALEIVLCEADEVIAETPWVLLTKKDGIYCANAGADKRNVPENHIVLWPKDAFESAKNIHAKLNKKLGIERIAVIITDSICVPGRLGSLALALGYFGIRGYHDLANHEDLFGNTYRYTGLNVVDSLATTANTLMGESTDLVPLVLIRGYSWQATQETKNDEMIIPSSDDMFPLD